jgi:hypothetical protein
MDFGVLLKEGETVRYAVRTGRGVSPILHQNDVTNYYPFVSGQDEWWVMAGVVCGGGSGGASSRPYNVPCTGPDPSTIGG